MLSLRSNTSSRRSGRNSREKRNSSSLTKASAREQPPLALQLPRGHPGQLGDAEVVEHNGVAGGDAGAEGGGKHRLAGARVLLRLQGAEDGLAVEAGMRRGAGVGPVVEGFAGVGGEDHHGVPEADLLLPVLVLQYAGVQQLQEQLQHVEVGLLDLVEQQHGAGMAPDEVGEQTRLGVLVARVEADQGGP
jgi:hypothetical protein